MAEPAFNLNNNDGLGWGEGEASIKTSRIRKPEIERGEKTNNQSNVVPFRKKQKLSNDWDYLEGNKLPSNPSSDQVFNATYKTKGLQPNLGSGNENTLSSRQKRNRVDEANDYLETGIVVPFPNSTTSLVQKSQTSVKNLKYRAKATRVNFSIGSWVMTLWFTVQLPFALISVLFLASALAAEGIINRINQPEGVAEAILTAPLRFTMGVAETARNVANQALGVIGSEVTIPSLTGFIDDVAGGLFAVGYAIVLALGIITVLGVYLQYTLSLLKPLSGEKYALKIGTLLLVIIGYSVPLLNIFPWVLLWLVVVWIYPR